MEQVLQGNLQKHPDVFGILKPIRHWLNCWSIQNSSTAHQICRFIPAQCPFERDIVILGHRVAHLPPLCKLNPFFEELVSLRFRALCYLSDHCGEDISDYL